MATAEFRDELGRLSIGDTFSTTTGSLRETPAETPAQSTAGDDDISRQDEDEIYARRWEEATDRAKDGMNREDRDTVDKCNSPEKLLDGLEVMQKSSLSSRFGLSDLLYELNNAQPFRDLLGVFAVMMLPNSVTTGIVWGLIYLAIKLSAEHENAAKSFAQMLLKIRRQLAILKSRSAAFEKSSASNSEKNELRRIYVDIFEMLVYFWRDCINYFRDYPPKLFLPQESPEWKELEKSFTDTMAKIVEAMEYLETFLKAEIVPVIHKPHTSTTGGALPLISVPESQTDIFVGREDILVEMERCLGGDSKTRDTLPIVSLWGIGGVGKTEIAHQYVRRYIKRHKGEVDAVLWFGAETPELLGNAFSRVAVELCLEGANIQGNPAHNLVLVRRWLRLESQNWLLVFDNVEDYAQVHEYIPWGTRGAVVVTTRYESVAKSFNRVSFAVKKFDSHEAEALLLRLLFSEEQGEDGSNDTDLYLESLPQSEKDAVTFLLTDIDGLALGVRQMAALIRHRQLTHDIAKFATIYRKFLPRLIAKGEGIQGHTLSTLWEMTFQSIKNDPNATTMLGIICCLEPDSIQKELFLPSDPRIAEGCLQFCQEEFEVDEASDVLIGVSLIESHRDTFSIHRLIQVAYLFRLDATDRQIIFNAASRLINHAFPKQIKGRQLYEQWTACLASIQHGQSLAALFRRCNEAKISLQPNDDFLELMENCAWYMYEAGNRRGVIELVDIALKAAGNNLDRAGRAHLLNTLGVTHFSFNDLAQCRKALVESQQIREEILDPGDEELANTYLNLGNLEAAEGKQDEAIGLFERSLSIRQNIPGAEGMVAVCHLTIARALLNKRDFQPALGRMQTSQRIFEETFGKDAYNHLFVYFARGNLYMAMGEMGKARASFGAALDMQLARAPTMLKVAAIYFKIGTIHYHLGEFESALKSLAEGLKVARDRGREGQGEEARNLRRQAQVLEAAAPLDDSSPLLSLAENKDPVFLKGLADRALFNLRGGSSCVFESQEDEEKCFNDLVTSYDR